MHNGTCAKGKIDGQCEDSHFKCKTAASATNINTGTSGWTWTCPGENGGKNASCSETCPTGQTIYAGKCQDCSAPAGYTEGIAPSTDCNNYDQKRVCGKNYYQQRDFKCTRDQRCVNGVCVDIEPDPVTPDLGTTQYCIGFRSVESCFGDGNIDCINGKKIVDYHPSCDGGPKERRSSWNMGGGIGTRYATALRNFPNHINVSDMCENGWSINGFINQDGACYFLIDVDQGNGDLLSSVDVELSEGISCSRIKAVNNGNDGLYECDN